MEQFTFFYRSRSPFSQWYPCSFTVAGIEFNCAEQYMMYAKAVLFGDENAARKILDAGEPRDQKALGRQVRNFNAAVWDREARTLVYRANHAKFTQNPRLLDALLATEGTTLVEASPTDRIWGIGMSEDDPGCRDRRKWRGTNWLGEVLTKVREDIIAERAGSGEA
jgi:hypothetical protein